MKRHSKTHVKKADYAEILDLFLWGLDKLMRPTLSNLLSGYEEYYSAVRHDPLLQRMERANLITRSGRGRNAVFVLTESGRQRALLADPTPQWTRKWDGYWRVVTFDLPETQRNDRLQLWKSLRAHKLGLLQRSVWVWPDNLEPILQEIVRAEGIPECFCGFESHRLFLCTNEEIVATAWDWEEIHRRQDGYLKSVTATLRILETIRELPRLATEARSERQAYCHAMEFDPLLPLELWPRDYRGQKVWAEHTRFRQQLQSVFSRFQRASPATETDPSKKRNDRFRKVTDWRDEEEVGER